MTVSQKRAIGYAIRAKENANRQRLLDKYGLRAEFVNSKYKSLHWFLKSKGVNPYEKV